MAYTFKLCEPSQKAGAGVCLVPNWLEEQISEVSSKFDENSLGNVNISLIKSDLSSEQNEAYPSYGNYHNVPSTQSTQAPQTTQQPANGSNESHANGNSAKNNSHAPMFPDKPVYPKSFCDNFYLRLISSLYAIQDEEQMAQAQAKLEGLVQNLENTFMQQL